MRNTGWPRMATLNAHAHARARAHFLSLSHSNAHTLPHTTRTRTRTCTCTTPAPFAFYAAVQFHAHGGMSKAFAPCPAWHLPLAQHGTCLKPGMEPAPCPACLPSDFFGTGGGVHTKLGKPGRVRASRFSGARLWTVPVEVAAMGVKRALGVPKGDEGGHRATPATGPPPAQALNAEGYLWSWKGRRRRFESTFHSRRARGTPHCVTRAMLPSLPPCVGTAVLPLWLKRKRPAPPKRECISAARCCREGPAPASDEF
jgi:hypothetical protein